MHQLEQRRMCADVEIREDDSGAPVIRGYAAVFDSLSNPINGFREKIAPGAFAGTIAGDIRALWNHNTDYPLGRTTNGTLKLSEDNRGLAVEITPPDTSWGRDAVEAIKRGDVDGMSFAFTTIDDGWAKDDAGQVVRTLRAVQLYEVSPVTFPAYPATTVAVRADGADYIPEIPAELRAQPDRAEADRLRAQADRERRLRLNQVTI